MYEKITRRSILLGSLGLAIFKLAEHLSDEDQEELGEARFLGVSNDVIFARSMTPDGKKLEFYKAPGGEKFVESNEISFSHDVFSVMYPEIYETAGGEKWARLGGLIKQNDAEVDAFIPYRQSEHVILGRKGEIKFLEEVSGGYRHPFATGKIVDKESIGKISAGDLGVFSNNN